MIISCFNIVGVFMSFQELTLLQKKIQHDDGQGRTIWSHAGLGYGHQLQLGSQGTRHADILHAWTLVHKLVDVRPQTLHICSWFVIFSHICHIDPFYFSTSGIEAIECDLFEVFVIDDSHKVGNFTLG